MEGGNRTGPATRSIGARCRAAPRYRRAASGLSEPALLRAPQLLPHLVHSGDHIVQFLPGRPARRLAQSAIGCKGEPLGQSVFQALPSPGRDIGDGFYVVALDIDDPDCHVDRTCREKVEPLADPKANRHSHRLTSPPKRPFLIPNTQRFLAHSLLEGHAKGRRPSCPYVKSAVRLGDSASQRYAP